MSQKIQFLKGQSERLSLQPLRPGAIYFTEDTRRLYIDSDTARLPVTVDYVGGQIFWVKLSGGEINWNGTSKTQTITSFYKEFNNDSSPSHELSEMITADSVLFMGKTVYTNADPTLPQPAIILSSSNETSITFQLYSVEGVSVPNEDISIWIQLYCPNPKETGYVPLDVIKSVFTRRVTLEAKNWLQSADKTYYYQIISYENIDFALMPYMITLSDDSIENERDFRWLEIAEVELMNEDGVSHKKSNLMIKVNTNISFDIGIDLCVIIAKGKIYNEIPNTLMSDELFNDEWVKITVPTQETITGKQFTVSNIPLASTPIGEDKFFLAYCPNNNDENFNKIANITFNNNTFTFTLKDEYTSIGQFTCVIIQLNNIATLWNYTLDSKAWQYIQDKEKNYYFYAQYIPPLSEPSPLNDAYMPIVFPTNKEKSSLFSKLIETKIYTINDQTRIQFFTDELLEEKLDITVINFR